MPSALAGRAVLLTRGAADDAPLLRTLRARGALALSLACVRIEPCADPEQLRAGLRALTGDDWVVLTSRAAADAVAGAAPDLRARVAAVGPATAERASVRGLMVSFVPSRATGADLARELPLTGGVALLARADRALPD
ncbi:MAG TPA: uroporphyrinogen-III synthase, partial [Candidatus Limnocylindrales bacterium]|nr:uroporphyrinogen-III synthase [Candidatus Limnocylindrales bacterium]